MLRTLLSMYVLDSSKQLKDIVIMISYHLFEDSCTVPPALVDEAESLHSQGFLFVDVFPSHEPNLFMSSVKSENTHVLYPDSERPSCHTDSTAAAIKDYNVACDYAEANSLEVEEARRKYPKECDAANGANISYCRRLEDEAREKAYATMFYSDEQKSRLGAYVTMDRGSLLSRVGLAKVERAGMTGDGS